MRSPVANPTSLFTPDPVDDIRQDNAHRVGAPNTQQSGEIPMVGTCDTPDHTPDRVTVESRQLVGQVGATALFTALVRRADGTHKHIADVHRPNAVAVLPVRITSGGVREGLFVRQARPVVGETGLWEVPAGKVDPGERPTDTAVRELREETGYVVTGLAALVTGLCVSPGYTTERMDIYAVTVAATRVPQRAEDAGIVAEWLPLSRMFSLDMKTMLAVLLAEQDTTLWTEVAR